MMIAFAEDLQLHALEAPSSRGAHLPDSMSVDIGLTRAPYYTDKSASIADKGSSPYPSAPTHVHLLGYDTLTRVLAPKYYSDFSPPLSALEPFFDLGHKLLVLLRPESSSDNAVTADTEEEQRNFIKDIADGRLEDQGMKRQWASQMNLLEGEDITSAAGISSTVIRRAAKNHDWNQVTRMCTPSVAEWIRDQGLYEDD